MRTKRGQVGGHASKLEASGVDARDVEQLGDQSGEPVGVAVDRLEHQPPLVLGEAIPLGQQSCGEALDPGQRGPQLVGHGRDQIGVLTFCAVARLGASQADDEACRPVRRAQLARRTP